MIAEITQDPDTKVFIVTISHDDGDGVIRTHRVEMLKVSRAVAEIFRQEAEYCNEV